MRQEEQDGEHIWLRQSVTFTTNGQTRTVEMGIPLRPGAPAEEIERLLDEAESNMRRVSQRLDSHVAALLNGNLPAVPSESASHVAPAVPATPVSAPTPTPSASAPATPPAPTASPRPAPRPERPTPAAASMPAPAPADAPAASAPSRPAPTSPAPSLSPARSRPSGPLAGPAPSPSPSPAAPTAGGELTRKDFLAATADMGLTVKQVMERLGVRTLEGLNLREALESLRRQMLRDGVPASAPVPGASTTPAAPAAKATSNGAAPVPSAASPRYFEEEDDDYDVTFTLDGDDALAEELDAYPPAGSLDDREDPDALDDLDLDDVPDFGPPPSSARASHSPSRRAAPARPGTTPPASSASAASAVPAEEPAPEPESALSPTDQRIAQLRAVHGGGAPTTHQRTAYRNVVVSELGDEAAALVRGLWRVNPERLGPEQLDALISWGKQDTFAEEAADTLATLRAERQQAQQAQQAAPAVSTEPAPAAPRPPQPRSRTQQPPRAPSGGR